MNKTMRIKLLDFPVIISIDQYGQLKEKLVSQLIDTKNVLSVYQMGSVKHPGISDLDLICVFRTGSDCQKDFRSNLNVIEKSILTHGIFGIEEKHFHNCLSLNLISNLTLLGGKNVFDPKIEVTTAEELKRQIAYEYLVKMYITLNTQVEIGAVKLRAFLLLAKALDFDLRLLDIHEGALYELVQNVIEFRKNWFTNRPELSEVLDLIFNFNLEIRSFLDKELSSHTLYLPQQHVKLPGNFNLINSYNLRMDYTGLTLPTFFRVFGSKYISMQLKLRSFNYYLPFEVPLNNDIHDKRFKFGRKLAEINRERFPAFIPLTTSLSVF